MRNNFVLLCLLFSSQIFPQQITLSDTTNQYDYLIITIPEYVQSCQVFKEHKETVRNFKTLVVDTTQIFAEFNSDSLPQNNIREFISYAGTYWQDPKPEYVLFVGTSLQIPSFELVTQFPPTPQEKTDYYYRINYNNPDTTEVSFLVGRIPASDTVEITNYFSKVIGYESISEPLPWMNNSLFLYKNDFMFGFGDFCFELANILPSSINSFFVTDSDTSIYFGNKDTIITRINTVGASLIWFEGFGSYRYFIDEEYFSIMDIYALENLSKYFVSIFVASRAAFLDTTKSMTTKMLFLKDAGSIAGFASVSLSYWGASRVIHRIIAENIFNQTQKSIGQLFREFGNIGGTVQYQISAINLWGDPSLILNYDATTRVENITAHIPQEFSLSQNYPNPFNPTTSIRYAVSSGQFVLLKVYDIIGKEVATLVNEEKPAGSYEVEFNASGLSSGIYFYQLNTGSITATKKMILLR